MGITLAVTSARSFSVVLGLHARPGGERQQGRMPHGPAEPAARCLVSISGQKIGFLSRESILPSVTSLKNIFQSKKKKKTNQQTIAWEEAMLFTPTSRHRAELGRGGVSSEAALCFKHPPRRVLAGVLILTHHAGSQQP